MSSQPAKLQSITPFFIVDDLAQTLAFYISCVGSYGECGRGFVHWPVERIEAARMTNRIRKTSLFVSRHRHAGK